MASEGVGINITCGQSGPVYDERHAYTIRVVSEIKGSNGGTSLEYDLLTNISDAKLRAILRFLRLLFDKAKGPIKNITIFSGGFDKDIDKFGTPVINLHNEFERFRIDFQNHEQYEAPTDVKPNHTYHFFLTGLAEKQGCSSCGSCCPKRNNTFLHLDLTEEEWKGANRVLSLISTQGITALEGITSITPLNDEDYRKVCDILHKNP